MKTRKAAAYIRTASKEDDGTLQRHKIMEFCERNGLELVRIVTDVGQNGLNLQREGLQDLFTYLGQNKDEVNQLVLTDVDRISLDVHHALYIQWQLESMGYHLHFVDSQKVVIDHDLTVLFSKMLASPEPSNRSASTSEGIKHARLAGKHPHKAPFGYTNTRNQNLEPILEINPQEAKIVRAIFEWYNKGTSLSDVYTKAREKGFRLKDKTSVSRILANPLYAGFVRLTDGQLIEGKFKAIVEWETFSKAQVRNSRKKVSGKRKIR